jgi:UDP-glucose 4-epimerase
VYNLGTNTGHSNLEVIQQSADVTESLITHKNGPQRKGDPAVLTADANKFMAVSGWQPKYTLKDMIHHAWAWYTR